MRISDWSSDVCSSDLLKAEHGKQAQASFQKFAARDDQVAQALAHEQLTDWTFGPLPEIMEIKRKGLSFVGYPALIDRQTHCDLEIGRASCRESVCKYV